MKTKHYEFTDREILALRDACIEHWHRVKHLTPQSPIAQEYIDCLKALKDQFINDSFHLAREE